MQSNLSLKVILVQHHRALMSVRASDAKVTVTRGDTEFVVRNVCSGKLVIAEEMC